MIGLKGLIAHEKKLHISMNKAQAYVISGFAAD